MDASPTLPLAELPPPGGSPSALTTPLLRAWWHLRQVLSSLLCILSRLLCSLIPSNPYIISLVLLGAIFSPAYKCTQISCILKNKQTIAFQSSIHPP